MRLFKKKGKKHNVFWSLDIVSGGVILNFGKDGTKGQFDCKLFDCEYDRDEYADRAISNKLKDGYKECGVNVGVPADVQVIEPVHQIQYDDLKRYSDDILGIGSVIITIISAYIIYAEIIYLFK